MIIAHNQKFVFIPIQKTGSTSIRESLDKKYNCVEGSSDPTSLIYNHTSACRLKIYFEECKTTGDPRWSWEWDEYFKFTFVRNPFARMVSQYNYFCKIGNGPKTVRDSNGDDFTYEDVYYNLCKRMSNEKSFSDFVKNEDYHKNLDVPYSWFCLDEFDYIGKTENIQTDFDQIVERINKNSPYSIQETIIIPHLNKSSTSHYSEMYDEESRKIVETLYSDDIDRFEYEFEGLCKPALFCNQNNESRAETTKIESNDSIVEKHKKYKSGYSLVTCSMNRTEYLRESIQTWNEIEELNEIIVVDYSSTKPISESDLPQPKFGKKIILVRVNNEKHWILSHAYNLGISFVNYDKLVKIDSDIKLSKDFISSHPLNENEFYRGYWENARNENEIHLNGQLICRTTDFCEVNGYNERITTYGYDDTDLYVRIEQTTKSKPTDFDYDKMDHIKSDAIARVKNQDIIVNERFAISDLFKNQQIDQEVVNELIWVPFPNTGEDLRLFLETQINRISCEKNTWTSYDIPIQWDIHTKSDNIYICERIVV
jgi:hypothetical protein